MARGRRTLWDQPERGGDLGAALGSTGSISAKPSGGSVSPLEDHAEFLLGLVTEQPDLTLDEVVEAMSKARIAGSRTAVWRFYERHDFVLKKNFVRGGAKACRGGPRAATLDARAGHV